MCDTARKQGSKSINCIKVVQLIDDIHDYSFWVSGKCDAVLLRSILMNVIWISFPMVNVNKKHNNDRGI